MPSHVQWGYACPVVHIKFLLAFAQLHTRRQLHLPHRPLQTADVSSGLPLYPSHADAACLEVLAHSITRAFGSGLPSHLTLLLARDGSVSAQASSNASRRILSRVFGQRLLAAVVEAGLSFEPPSPLRLRSSPPIALQLQPSAAFAYLCARGNCRWWDAARTCDLYGVAAHIDMGADVTSFDVATLKKCNTFHM